MRAKRIIPVRREPAYRLRNERKLTWNQIGRILQMDHTSALYHCNKFVEGRESYERCNCGQSALPQSRAG
jgi:hypothetical protein